MPSLVLVSVAWIAGLIVAHHWLVPMGVRPMSLAVLSLIPLALLFLWRTDRWMRLSSACALTFLLAVLRYQAHVPNLNEPGSADQYNDQGWITMEGVVMRYPEAHDTWTNLHLDAEWIEVNGQVHPVDGAVLVRAPRFPEYHYGDRLQVSGLLKTPPEFDGFSYRDYLARKGIHSLVYGPRIERVGASQGSPFWMTVFAVKDRARGAIARLVPDPEASLMQGIILGIESGIPNDLYDDYRVTGASHIIVISGANITIVAALFAFTFGRALGRRRAYWLTLAGIILYVLLVGADPVVIRAGVMGALFVTALRLGRRSTAYVSLFASAVLLTLINPFSLWDLGFQLSFAATLGLILFTPALERSFDRILTPVVSAAWARDLVRYFNDFLTVTLAAQIMTIPLLVHAFGQISLVAPLTNLLILPVQPPIMIAGGLATLFGLVPILEPVARVIAWVPWLCLAYTNAIVRWMAGWPFASVQIGQPTTIWLVLFYGLLLGTVWAIHIRNRQGHVNHLGASTATRPATKIIIGLLLAAAILSWLAILQLPDGRLHVAFLDVGQGDAILITTPQGQQILMDGGPSPTALASGLGKQMPFWDRSIDLLVMTHPDADHVTGLVEVLARYRVHGWLDNGSNDKDAVFCRCQDLLNEAEVPRHETRAGERLDLGRGLALEVLHPPGALAARSAAGANNDSVVLRLVWDQASFLLTGDIEAEGERLLLQSGQPLSASVLKVGHHGSDDSSTADFLAAVDPRYAVISVGIDNPFGHPEQDLLDRLAQQDNLTILRTDEQGTIEFTTDGQRLWIRTEH